MIISRKRLKIRHFWGLSTIALLLLTVGCRVEQEQAGELPDVDVQVEPGQLPQYDVDGPEVNVRTEEQEVTVPQIEVTEEERNVEVPYIDIDPPQADQ